MKTVPDRRKSVGLVVHDFSSNFGHGRYCVELVKHLHDKCDFHIFANTISEPLPSSATFHHIKAWRKSALLSILTFLASSGKVSRFKGLDFIHSQGLTCWSADLITAHVCNAARYQLEPAKSLRKKIFPGIILPLEKHFFAQPRAQRLIAVSEVIRSEIKGHYGWAKPSTVIYHGIDTEKFKPEKDPLKRAALQNYFGLTPGKWKWLFAGEASKGLKEVISQLADFPDAELLVISRSKPHEYLTLAAEMKVEKQLRFFGVETQIWKAYQATDLFVYPSTYDAFGMVVAEAMASGLPVVVGKSIGAAELISHGVDGFLFEPKNTKELRGILKHLQLNLPRAEQVGTRGLFTLQTCSWHECAKKTWQVYSTMASRL